MAGSRTGYSQLRIFICPAWVRVRDGQRELRISPCVFLGYSSGGYRLWCSSEVTPGTMINKDVTPNEFSSWTDKRREGKTADPDRSSKK